MTTTDESAESPQRSEKPDAPSSGSNGSWRAPDDLLAFAAQANDVTTRFLNGEIDIDTARTYASLGRVVVQAVSSQVTKDRFLQREPDLSLRPKKEKP